MIGFTCSTPSASSPPTPAIAAGQLLLREAVVVDVLQRAVGHPHGLALMAERVELRAHLADEAGEVVLLRDAGAFFLRLRRRDDR